jgi:hypothetical protein
MEIGWIKWKVTMAVAAQAQGNRNQIKMKKNDDIEAIRNQGYISRWARDCRGLFGLSEEV